MKMKVISYCLFFPKQLPNHRFWDDYKNDVNRYFYNIPAVVMTNQMLFPDYITRIYITKNLRNIYEIFNILSEQCNLELIEIDIDYKLTEPTIFRMKPLWENIGILHTRDLDSIISKKEYQYMRSFETSSCSIGTLRSHENHYGAGCKMLAGLSSFKPKKIPINIKGTSFLDYYKKSNHKYGCDQDLIIKTFTKDHDYTKSNFLDCKIHNQTKSQDFPCIQCSQIQLDEIPISISKQKIFDRIHKLGYDSWAGVPVDCRGEYTSFISNYFFEIKNLMVKNKNMYQFYKIYEE